MKKTIIVMPVANEEETMRELIEEILAFPYDNLFLYPVIDNYSKDRTEEIIREFEPTGRVKCIFHEKSHGVVDCYLEGFRQALLDGAEWIVEMDGGYSHLPKELPQFIGKLEEGYECVWGSRFIEGGEIAELPLYRRILSGGGTFLSNLVLGTKLKDMTSGYEAFQKEVLLPLNLEEFLSKGHMYQTEMRFYCRNRKAVEVPIHYVGGQTSLKMKSVTNALSVLFQLKKHEMKVQKK